MEVRREAMKAEIREVVMEFFSNSGLVEEDAPRQEGRESEDAERQREGSVEREMSLQELDIRKLVSVAMSVESRQDYVRLKLEILKVY